MFIKQKGPAEMPAPFLIGLAGASGWRLLRWWRGGFVFLLVSGEFFFQSLNLCLFFGERVHESLKRRPVDLGAGLLGTEDGVPQRLRRLVGELPRAEGLEPCLASCPIPPTT